MAEHLLDGAEVGAAFEQVGGEGVAEGVGRYFGRYAGLGGEVFDYVEYAHAGYAAACSGGEEDVVFFAVGDFSVGSLGKPVAEGVGRYLAQGHESLFGAFANDREVAFGEIEAPDFEVYGFADAESAAVEGFYEGAVAQGLRRGGIDGVDHGVDFVDAED